MTKFKCQKERKTPSDVVIWNAFVIPLSSFELLPLVLAFPPHAPTILPSTNGVNQ
jgi:hypothetical protein